MRAHIIENGIIVNTVEVASLDVIPNLVAPVGVEQIGWSWNNGSPTAPVMPIDTCCTTRCSEVAALFATKIATGLVHGGNTYQIDGDSHASIGKRATYATLSTIDSVAFPWGDPYNRGWWDTTNVYHAMTATEFLTFAKAVSDYVSTCAAVCRDHKNALETLCSANDSAGIASYDITAGW